FGRAVGWNFTAGRDFDRTIAGDSSAMVLNAAAIEQMGLEDPVGKVIHWKNQPWGMDKDFTIIGVVENMVMNSPFEPAKASVYFIMPYTRMLLIRISPDVAVSDALPKIERVFHD